MQSDMITSKGDTNMSHRRAKTSGWAAFDMQQKQKDQFGSQSSDEPFPSLSSKVASSQPATTLSRNNHPYIKPFSSVIVPPLDFPATLGNENDEPAEIGSSIGPQSCEIAQNNKLASVFRQLKERFSWGDDSLIEDVMAAVDNDFGKASSFLEAMVPNENLEKNKQDTIIKSTHDSMEPVCNDKAIPERREVLADEISKASRTCSMLSSRVGGDNRVVRDGFYLCSEKLSDGYINAMLEQFTSVPVEPEWEEDDVYLTCRKDAIKMMRAAARHSKSATNSFLRGDHFAAQQFSQKAREEWVTAKKLNEKAACEILSIRNENNGLWKLDLHGLHAAEAVQALQERLHSIETRVLSKGSSTSVLANSFGTKAKASYASSGGFNNMERSDQRAVSGEKPKCLEVITGIGNHSRGGAALPTAVKTFLADNGYHFDEARPGVIMVRPKFRHV